MTGVLVVLAALVAGACDAPRSSARPSASLLDVEFTPQPTRSSGSSEGPTDEPSFVSIPVGWENAFCSVFADAVVAQELVIDVERALDEEDFHDARLLARDLRDITADATTLLAELPEWESATQVSSDIARLIDLGARAGTEYGAYFADDERALRRARTLRREILDRTPAANEALAELDTLGIICEGQPLVLEHP
ncbi:MAG: hypothetical protein ACR2H0_05720 [Candidatus Limnocylindrales bacterium]